MTDQGSAAYQDNSNSLSVNGSAPSSINGVVQAGTISGSVYFFGGESARPATHRTMQALLGTRTSDGRPPLVRECDDPVVLGVHAPGTPPVSGVRAGRHGHVRRDIEPRLSEALAAGGIVLVIGEALAGKSHLAYEVVRREYPDRVLVAPANAASLPFALERAVEIGDCLVWLDDLSAFLRPGASDLRPIVTAVAARHVAVLATMSSTDRIRLDRAREPHDTNDLGRNILRSAYQIHVARLWSGPEMLRAQESPDPRLRAAARHAAESTTVGPAEVLVTAPQLVARWHDAWAVGAYPRGAAIVAAAVDARRADVRRGLSKRLLRSLHTHYLEARGGLALSPESFDKGMKWATGREGDAARLLTPTDRRCFRAPSHLAEVGASVASLGPVPPRTWNVLLDHASREEYWDIGEAAFGNRQLDVALDAFTRLARAGHHAARIRVADCVGESGDRRQAMELLQALVEKSRRVWGSADPRTCSAVLALAGWTGRAGDLQAALSQLRQLAAETGASLGVDNPAVLAVLDAAANWTGRSGDLTGAVAVFRDLVARREVVLGPNHPDTLESRYELANWLARSGQPGRALAQHEVVVAVRTRVLGPDHADTLRSRHRAARLLCEVASAEAGILALAQVIDDRTRVLGPEHPDTLRSRTQLCRWMGKSGDIGTAREAFRVLAEDYAKAVGADHPDTLRARHHHARWVADEGDPTYGIVLFDRLLADWQRVLGPTHPYTLATRFRRVVACWLGGSLDAAKAMLAELVRADAELLGDEPPYTVRCRATLAKWKSEI
jgi:hypothetical protein